MTHFDTKRIVQNIMNSFADIINLWPTAEAFAQDIEIEGQLARAMKRRNNIDQKYWVDVVSAAENRDIPNVTLEQLAQIASLKRSVPPPSAAE